MKFTPSLVAAMLLTFSLSTNAKNELQTINIWPGLAPGTAEILDEETWNNKQEVEKVYQPNITVFLPKKQKAPTAAMLVFPGGGYKKLTMRKEGYSIANWAAENGIAAFVLKYRLDRKDALRDAQRAMSFIRSNAAEYNIDKDKIGTIGFSAGAHLSANLAINHDERENTDKIDAASAKPNFWIPIYGGFWQIFGQPGKFIPLNELPPTFIVHASNDSKAPVSSSINLFSRLHEQNVPVEMHIYAQGEHGFALERGRGETTTSTVDNWSQRCLEWLRLINML